MDPKGILEMLLMFLDGKGNGVLFHWVIFFNLTET
jgi:hypothetical protein